MELESKAQSSDETLQSLRKIMKSTNAKEKVKMRFAQQNQSKFQKVRKSKKLIEIRLQIL